MYKIFIFLAILSSLLFSCSTYEGLDAASRRVQQLTSPEETTTIEGTPKIVLDQEIKNCTDNPNCSLQAMGENTNPLRINSLIVAEANILSSQNINNAPAIRFAISDVDISDIENVTYTYIKKDSLENIIVKLDEKTVAINGSVYYIPLHVSNLGSSIMSSAPYERHILSIKIKTSNRKTYSYDVEFAMLSNNQNPVIFNRSNTIMDSSYYKMDQDLSDFVIDSIDMSNTVPYAVTVSGNINISSDTTAILSNTHRVQLKAGLPHSQYYYPWDVYSMTTGTNIEYQQAVANPMFRLVITRSNQAPEEIATTISPSVNYSILSFSDLTLQGNETIKIDLYIHVDTNNFILGPQGEETLFEGQTICENVTPTSECKCFYYVPDLHTVTEMMYGIYGCGVMMYGMVGQFYPNCSAPPDNPCLQKFLNIVNYPHSFLELVGRDHKTNTSYTITSWLKGYQDLEALGSSTRTFDPIHVTKGYVNYASINNALSYTGYIPGHVE